MLQKRCVGVSKIVWFLHGMIWVAYNLRKHYY